MHAICRCDFFAISYGFLDPWKAGNHTEPLEGLAKVRFRTFRKRKVPCQILKSFWDGFWNPLAPQIIFLWFLEVACLSQQNHAFWNRWSIYNHIVESNITRGKFGLGGDIFSIVSCKQNKKTKTIYRCKTIINICIVFPCIICSWLYVYMQTEYMYIHAMMGSKNGQRGLCLQSLIACQRFFLFLRKTCCLL